MDRWIDGEEEAADLLQSLHRVVRKMARRTRRTRETRRTAGPDERNHDPVTSMAAIDPERDGRGKEAVVGWRRGQQLDTPVQVYG